MISCATMALDRFCVVYDFRLHIMLALFEIFEAFEIYYFHRFDSEISDILRYIREPQRMPKSASSSLYHQPIDYKTVIINLKPFSRLAWPLLCLLVVKIRVTQPTL
jgi:hypothetical protein